MRKLKMINNNLHKLVVTPFNSGGESMSIVEQLMAEKQNLEIQIQHAQAKLAKVVETLNAYQGEEAPAQQSYNEPPQQAITPDEVIQPEQVAPEQLAPAEVTDDFLDQLRQG